MRLIISDMHDTLLWDTGFRGYVQVFDAFYDAQYCSGMCYNDLILLGA